MAQNGVAARVARSAPTKGLGESHAATACGACAIWSVCPNP